MRLFTRFHVLSALFAALIVLSACAPQPGAAPSASGASDSFSEVAFIGTLESTSPSEWIVSGQVVKLNAQTQVQNTPAIGETVQVHARVSANGEVTALRIETQTRQQAQAQSALEQSGLEFLGVVERIDPSVWVVSGRTFSLDASTEVKGSISVGSSVKVEYTTSADGAFIARQITPADGLQAGNTIKLNFQNLAAGAFELFGVVEAINPNTWTVAGQTFAVTPQTEIKAAIVVGDFVKAHLFDAGGVLTAREIDLAIQNAQGAYLEFSGVVESLTLTEIVVSGQRFTLTPDTRFKGAIALGDTVKVEAIPDADGNLLAREVRILPGGAASSSSSLSGGASSSSSSLSGGASSSSKSSSGSSSSSKSSSSSSSSSDDDDHDDGYDDDDKGGSGSSSSSKSKDD